MFMYFGNEFFWSPKLVNNGGGQFFSPAEQISSNGWKAVVETNFYGPWNCMQEAFDQYMRDNGGNEENFGFKVLHQIYR